MENKNLNLSKDQIANIQGEISQIKSAQRRFVLLKSVGRVIATTIATTIATPFSTLKLATHGIISLFNEGANHSSIEEIRTGAEKPIKLYDTAGYKNNIVYRFIKRLEDSIMFATSTR